MSARVTEAHRAIAARIIVCLRATHSHNEEGVAEIVAKALADAEAAERECIITVVKGFYDPEGGMTDHLDAAQEIGLYLARGQS